MSPREFQRKIIMLYEYVTLEKNNLKLIIIFKF